MNIDETQKKSKSYQNLPSVIADELRESILNCEIQAGEKLKQEEIAVRFASSLIPVREALRNLETEGLVTFYPNKGAYVSELSLKNVRDIFETRIFIETGALELSVPKLTKEDITKCKRFINQLDKATTGKELSYYNMSFHSLLLSKCGNEFLLDLIQTLHHNIERYMRMYLVDHYNNDLSQDSHRKILLAVKEKDIVAAKNNLEAHMRMAMNNLVGALQNQ